VAAAIDRDAVGVGADGEDSAGAASEVDDRDLVGLVERDDEARVVRRHGDADRPALLRPFALGVAAGRGGKLERVALVRVAAGGIDGEHVDRVAGVGLRRPRRRRAAARLARDVGGAAVVREGDPAVGARQRRPFAVRKCDGPISPWERSTSATAMPPPASASNAPPSSA
jgi:hypothetical protein